MLFHKWFNGGFSRYSSNQTQPDRPRIIQSIESNIKTVGRKVRDLAVEIYKFTSKKPILTQLKFMTYETDKVYGDNVDQKVDKLIIEDTVNRYKSLKQLKSI